MPFPRPALLILTLAALVSLGACSDGTAPTTETETGAATPTSPPNPNPIEAGSDPALPPELAIADAFVEAFYSFDAERLGTIMAAAEETAPRLLNYQASAFGGNYEVLERVPCFWDQTFDMVCPVTVKDDRVQALGTGFDVTDVFHLTFEDGVLVKVTTSSNDQDIYRQAAVWVRENMTDIMEGPCANRGTPEYTPVECSRAMTRGYEAFVASDDFPGVPPLPKDVKFY